MMLGLLLQLGVGFVIALYGVLIPGPLLVFITMKTMEIGPRAGSLAALGHILIELSILSFVGFGLGVILESQVLVKSVGLVSGVLLITFGVFILGRGRSSRTFSNEPVEVQYSPIIGGMLFSTIFNPFVFLWWATIGLVTLMTAIKTAGVSGGIFWIMGHFLADLSWASAVSYSLHKGKEIVGGRFYRTALILCRLALLGFGTYFVYRYLPTFF